MLIFLKTDLGQLFKKTGKLIKLSEQQLLDCSRGPAYSRNKGCKGGVVSLVFDYVKLNGVTENSTYAYPYQANDTFACSYNPSTSVTKLSDYVWPQSIDEIYLKNLLVKIGPLSVRKRLKLLKTLLLLLLFFVNNYRSALMHQSPVLLIISQEFTMMTVAAGKM